MVGGRGNEFREEMSSRGRSYSKGSVTREVKRIQVFRGG